MVVASTTSTGTSTICLHLRNHTLKAATGAATQALGPEGWIVTAGSVACLACLASHVRLTSMVVALQSQCCQQDMWPQEVVCTITTGTGTSMQRLRLPCHMAIAAGDATWDWGMGASTVMCADARHQQPGGFSASPGTQAEATGTMSNVPVAMLLLGVGRTSCGANGTGCLVLKR